MEAKSSKDTKPDVPPEEPSQNSIMWATAIKDLDEMIARLTAALREYACTGTDHPCGCYAQFLSERAEIERLRAALFECQSSMAALGETGWSDAAHLSRVIRTALTATERKE